MQWKPVTFFFFIVARGDEIRDGKRDIFALKWRNDLWWMKSHLKIMKFENKICGCKLFLHCISRILEQHAVKRTKYQHNIETCNSKTVGPANRLFPENTKRIEIKQQQQHQQITNNDKPRKNKGEWCEVTAQTSRWRQTLRLVANNAMVIFYSVLGFWCLKYLICQADSKRHVTFHTSDTLP